LIPPTPFVIAVANRKGGAGKTTTAVNLAAALARGGVATLLVDLDTQGHAGLGLWGWCWTKTQRVPTTCSARGQVRWSAPFAPPPSRSWTWPPLTRYVALYNHQFPQSALKSKTPMRTMKDWHATHPFFFNKRPYDRPGCDT